MRYHQVESEDLRRSNRGEPIGDALTRRTPALNMPRRRQVFGDFGVQDLAAGGTTRATNWPAWSAAIILATGLLLAPALWNRFPLLQWDTGGYLARWFEGYLVPSRPGAYGLLLAAAFRAEFWPVLLTQVAATLWILTLLLKEFGLGRRPLLLLGIIAVLSATTTLPWLTSTLLTDIFAGLAIIALHLLVFGSTPSRPQKLGLIVFIAFAAATHSATLAVVAALAVAAAVAAFFSWTGVAPAGARRAVLAAGLGVVATLGGNAAVSGQFAFTPGGYGILFGRMLQDGIVSRYLHDRCPDRMLKLCPYRAVLPLDADEFLWGGSVFNSLGRFAGLGAEMRTIVLGSLHDYPWLQVEAAVSATVRQLGTVASGEGVVDSVAHTYGIMERYTPAVVPAMRAARQQHGEISFEAINRVHVPVGLLSAALLPVLLVFGRKRRELDRLRALGTTLAVALLANAFVCGALANPHDRYGARLIWLAPLIMMLVAVSLRAAATQGQARRRDDSAEFPAPITTEGPSVA